MGRDQGGGVGGAGGGHGGERRVGGVGEAWRGGRGGGGGQQAHHGAHSLEFLGDYFSNRNSASTSIQMKKDAMILGSETEIHFIAIMVMMSTQHDDDDMLRREI